MKIGFKMKVVLVFCVLLCGHSVLSGYVGTFGNLGQKCLYDDQCVTTNSYCKGEGEEAACSCKIGYDEYDAGMDFCFPTRLNTTCFENYHCSGLKNAVCLRNTCQCEPLYVATENMENCLQMSRLTLTCQEDSQCSSTVNSICNSTVGQCVCKKGYHQAIDNYECIQNAGLGDICTFTRECYTYEDQVGKLKCQDGSPRTCTCEEEYVQKGDRCEKDGSSVAMLSSSTLLAFFVVKCLL